MKFKFSWIPFIPVAILSVILRVYQKLFIDMGIDTGFISTEAAWVAYTALVALLFLILIILCCADRKTSPYCKPKFNFIAGLFGVLTAAVIIFYSGVSLGNIATAEFSDIIDSIFGILGGIAILVMGVSSFSGKNFAKKMGIFSIAAPLWCCVRMVTTFIEYTKQSVHSMDMTNLFFMSFMTLALFNLALVYQELACKNPVKGTILYGMPGFVVTIVYAAANAIDQFTSTGTYDIMGSLDIISFVLLAFYMLFMMIELLTNATEKVPAIEEIEDNALPEEKAEQDEISAVQATKSVANHVDITDVEETVNKELDDVDNILDAMEQEKNDPEKYSPHSQEYFNSRTSSISEDDELTRNLADIEKLINEINTESNN